MAKVQLDIDSDGYINGWTDEPYADKSKLVEVDTASIVLGASKLVDGEIFTDTEKAAAMFKPVPTQEQQMIAALFAKISALEGKS